MTLIVAWRQDDTIHVAADSRISFRGQHTEIDVGAKIVPLVVRVEGPTPAGGNMPAWVKSHRLGLAVAGSGTTASVLQASLGAFMGSMSSVSEPIDMASMARIVEQVFQYIGRTVCAALGPAGLGEVMLVGWCDVENRPRAFLFEIEVHPNQLTVRTSEILTGTAPEYRGSGRTAVRSLGPTVHPFDALKQVVLDPAVPSVGGPVQYGRVIGTDFRMYMVEDYETDDEDHVVTVGMYLYGLPVYGGDAFLLPDGYVKTGKGVLPYRRRIEMLVQQGYELRHPS